MPYSPAQADVVMAGTIAYKDTHPARYWLPRLARWTGARLNELHQLRRIDVVERDGIHGISITDHGECMPGLPMRLKNAGSRRWVPLHPEVAEFWNWARGRPEGALFPADANKFGVVSDALSKWYGRALRGPWRIEDERITFHSWRHAFSDMCRAAGVPPDVRMALMGHSESGAAGAYGAGQMPAIVLDRAIRSIPALQL
jgi:integrase